MAPLIGSLCTGTGALDIAVAEVTGATLAWVADPDPDVQLLLAARHPGIPNLGDITTADWSAVPRVDIVTAGFPCQDVSAAGRRAGLRPGTRSGLWLHVAAAIAVLQPGLVVIENVEGIRNASASASSDVEPCPVCLGVSADGSLRALGAVLGDLSALGLDAEWETVPASAAGCCHRRERVFIWAWRR